jgi:hypothetical protein
MNVPSLQQLKFTDTDVSKLASDQFSVSARGTHTLRGNALLDESESALRAKIIHVQTRTADFKKALALEEQALALRKEHADDGFDALPPAKKKQRRVTSDDEDDVPQSSTAISCFLRDIRCKINNAEYIDFASISTTRLMEIRLLNNTAQKTTKIAVGLLFKHSLSEADVATLSEDLVQIHDGFFFNYLRMIGESQLENPLATILDRISWWQWLCRTFKANPIAQVVFIKEFVSEHSKAPAWTPIARSETDMVMRIKNDIDLSTRRMGPPDARKSSGQPPPKSSRPLKVVTTGNRNPQLSPAQIIKLNGLKVRFPGICVSRIAKGWLCAMEGRNMQCRWTHVCAWCLSPSCAAACAQAEHL